MRPLLVSLLIVVALLTAATTAPADNGDSPLRIATEGAYPPFNYVDDEGKLQGFDIEIACAVCAALERRCEFITEKWADLIGGLEAGRYDAIVASMSITAERSERVDFTQPYYRNRLNFVAANDNLFEITETGLRGRRLGAQRDTIASAWLLENVSDIADVRLYTKQEDVYRDLAAGELDAGLADMLAQYAWLATQAGRDFDFRGPPVVEDDRIAIAVRRGNDELRQTFNRALREIRDSSVYQAINDRYFPFDIY